MSNPEAKENLNEIPVDQITGISRKTTQLLREFEGQLRGRTFLDWFKQKLEQDRLTLARVAEQVGVKRWTLTSLAKRYEISYMSNTEAFRAMLARRGEHPEWQQKSAEATKAKWQDPEYRSKMAIVTGATLRRKWQDPEFRKKKVEAAKVQSQDPNFRQTITEAVRVMLAKRWQDSEWRQRHIIRTKAILARRWQDPQFRQRISEAARQSRLDPQILERSILPTIYGERWDVGYAQSAWEANLARVLRFVGRDVIARAPLRLRDGFIFELDFLTRDNRGNLVGYEIMAHPLEEPEGWNKLKSAISQYPEISFRVIDSTFYRKLEKRFANRINQDDRFAGWENSQDNLRNDPGRYAVTK